MRRPARRASCLLLLALAACGGSSGTGQAPPPAPSAPQSGTPVATTGTTATAGAPATTAATPAPASVDALLRAAAVREETIHGRTGSYVDAEHLGYIVKAGVIFEAIPRPGSYCLDAAVNDASPRFMLDGDTGGTVVPGECPRP